MKGSVSGIKTGKPENIIPEPIRPIYFSKTSVSIRIFFSNKVKSLSRCNEACGPEGLLFSMLKDGDIPENTGYRQFHLSITDSE
jgi:hypothetical protein